ncbi:hypothetical protein B0H17DRAFT_1202766 [Mycena rosella]|uniref:Transmembrane protein n=1 Tax=Mycena rosella TaxID=1033263 RepID=A0AAD7DD03_MYCRO|nr:hypothetical protein B0H17DRAFT_1202766 [Mycena rosella]
MRQASGKNGKSNVVQSGGPTSKFGVTNQIKVCFAPSCPTQDMELLRKLIPSQASISSFMVPFLKRYSNLIVSIKTWICIGIFILGALVSLVIIPLLSALFGNTPDGVPVRPPPNDEESRALVPDPVGQSGPAKPNRGLRGFLSELGAIFAPVGAALTSVLLLRPRDASLLQGIIAVLMLVIKDTGMAIAVLFCTTLLVSAPLLIIWVLVRRLSVEPYKSSWYRILAVCTRITFGVVLYLLAIEDLTLYQLARLEAVVPHLTWQASLLSELCRSFGLEYFLDRALIKLSPETRPPEPGLLYPRLYQGLMNFARFIPLPIAMICNGHLRSASSAAAGLVSAAIFIAWITASVLALCVFDVLVYWTYFFWASRRESQPDSPMASKLRPSPADTMAVALFRFAVPDSTGQTIGERGKSRELEETARLH